MAAGIRVTLNHGGMGSLLKSDEVRNGLTARAEEVEAQAHVTAPFDTGEYAASIHIEQATTDRAVVRVVADAPHALVVEANTGNLARALDAAGGGI